MGPRPHILVVDDDPDFCDLVRHHFEGVGYQVSTAGSARDANHVLSTSTIALAIVDGFLADRDGESWITAQRRQGNRALRVIFISAFATYARDFATQQRLTRDLGVDYVLPKPLTPTDLQAYVDKILQRDVRVHEAQNKLATLRKTYGAQLHQKLASIATTISLAKSTKSPLTIEQARRLAHSLEGTAGSYGFQAVGQAAGRVSALLGASTPLWDAVDASVRDLRTRVEMAQSAL